MYKESDCSCTKERTQNAKVLLLRCSLLALGERVISVLHILDLLVFPSNAIITIVEERVCHAVEQ